MVAGINQNICCSHTYAKKNTLLINFKLQNQFQETKKNHFQSQAVKQIKNTSYM